MDCKGKIRDKIWDAGDWSNFLFALMMSSRNNWQIKKISTVIFHSYWYCSNNIPHLKVIKLMQRKQMVTHISDLKQKKAQQPINMHVFSATSSVWAPRDTVNWNICFQFVWVCVRERETVCLIPGPEGRHISQCFKAEAFPLVMMWLVRDARQTPLHYLQGW